MPEKLIITATIGKQTLQCRVTVKAILSMTKVTLAKNDFINLSLKGASIKSISSDKPSTCFCFKDKTIQGIKKGKATITVVELQLAENISVQLKSNNLS